MKTGAHSPYHCEVPLFKSVEGIYGAWPKGDGIKMFLDIGSENTINGLYYQISGDDYWKSFLSRLAREVEGRDLLQVFALPYEEWEEFYPGESRPLVNPAIFLLSRLITDYQGAGKELYDRQKGALVCRCFGVGETQIKIFLKQRPSAGVRDITDNLMAGGGCTTCLPDLEEMVHQHGTGLKTDARAARLKFADMTPVQAILEADDFIRRWCERTYPAGDVKFEILQLVGKELRLKHTGAEIAMDELEELEALLGDHLGCVLSLEVLGG